MILRRIDEGLQQRTALSGGSSRKFHRFLNIHMRGAFFKLLKAEKLPSAGPWAGFTNLLPFLLRFQIGFPEWPRPALTGSDGIHSTFAFL